MRRSLLFVCLAAMSITLAAQSPAAANTKPKSKLTPPQVAQVAAQQVATAAIKDLPVRKVVLYKNGVGYFEHAGSVNGNQRVAIDFTSPQLNDVLQSLTVLDEGGGRIGGVNYNSTTPLAEQLKSLSLGMGDDPTSTELFQALRGQRVEVTGGPGGTIVGRLMSIESRNEKAGKDDSADGATVDKFFLTLVASSGAVRVIELTPALSVRPLDANLQGQLDRYLELLSTTHSTGLRHLTLDTLGQGQRQLRVSYISEVPVWKSTYRIVFPRTGTSSEPGASAILQGWAVVDNTVGADWDNVQLSLVAGAPQSFIQPLSQPIYTRRPEIPIATEEQTTPQTHEAAEDKQYDRIELAAKVFEPPPAAAPRRVVPKSVRMASEREAPPTASYGVAGMEGLGGGGVPGAFAAMGRSKDADGVDRPTDAIQPGDVSTNAFDDFFEYALAQPVTIHKNESAMVPILQQELPAEHVTLWSEKENTPLRAIWLENKSKLTLDSGSFSIFESGEFAGEGLLDPIHPGEKRLLSYAADQAVRVHRGGFADTRTLHHIAIHDGVLVEQTTDVTESTYTVTNAADEDRTVIVEHARHGNAVLDSEPQPAETTATAYRFRVAVKPHESVNLHVGEKAVLKERVQINPDSARGEFLVSIGKYTPELEEKLKPVVEAAAVLSKLNYRIDEISGRLKTLADDEARDRENLTALKGNDAAKRFVDELNRAEDEIDADRKKQADLETERDNARAHLAVLIAALSFDADLSIVTQSNQYGDRPPRR
jgi:hypothetical protein